ncbi:MAG: hypothetical protein NC236_00375 [Mycoplasma sp.]|nr:hypothetical protein [Mycoplasma sp.]
MLFIYFSLFLIPIFLRLIRLKNYYWSLASVACSYAILTIFSYIVFKIGIKYDVFIYIALIVLSIPIVFEAIMFIKNWNKAIYYQKLWEYLTVFLVIFITFFIITLFTTKMIYDYHDYIRISLRTKYQNETIMSGNQFFVNEYIYNYIFYIASSFTGGLGTVNYFVQFLSLAFSVVFIFISFQIFDYVKIDKIIYKYLYSVIIITSLLFSKHLITANWQWISFELTSSLYILMKTINLNKDDERDSYNKDFLTSGLLFLMGFGISEDVILMFSFMIVIMIVLLLKNQLYFKDLSFLFIYIYIVIQIGPKNITYSSIINYISFSFGILSLIPTILFLKSSKKIEHRFERFFYKIINLSQDIYKLRNFKIGLSISLSLIFCFAIPIPFILLSLTWVILPICFFSLIILLLMIWYEREIKTLIIFSISYFSIFGLIILLQRLDFIVTWSVDRYYVALFMNIPIIVMVFIDWKKISINNKKMKILATVSTTVLAGNLYTFSPLTAIYGTNFNLNLSNSTFDKEDTNYLTKFIFENENNFNLYINDKMFFDSQMFLSKNDASFQWAFKNIDMYYNWNENIIKKWNPFLFGDIKPSWTSERDSLSKKSFEKLKNNFNNNNYDFIVVNYKTGWINHINKNIYYNVYSGKTMEIWKKK